MALVTYQEQDAFSLITLDDGKANALSFAMADGLDSALDQGFESGKVHNGACRRLGKVEGRP